MGIYVELMFILLPNPPTIGSIRQFGWRKPLEKSHVDYLVIQRVIDGANLYPPGVKEHVFLKDSCGCGMKNNNNV